MGSLRDMYERLTMIIAILAVLLSVVAIMSGLGIKPADVDVNSVGEKEIIDDAVTTDKILDNTILPEDLHSSVTNYIIERFYVPDNAVSSRNIVDGSITIDDMDNNSVGSDQIIDFSVNTSDIANGSITNEKLANNALQWDDIKGIPIQVFAAGYIKSDATVEYGYNVLSVDYNPSTKFYTINTTGYEFGDNYITVVSTYGSATSSQVAHSVYGPTIWLYNSSGYYQQSDFYFVTYKIN